MSKTLAVLVKLSERRVEEAQSALNRMMEGIRSVSAALDDCERRARDAFLQGVGEDDLRLLQAASAFQERMKRERAELTEVLRVMRLEEVKLREALHRQFSEQKRYELLLERKKIAEARRHAKKVQNNLDDIAQRRL